MTPFLIAAFARDRLMVRCQPSGHDARLERMTLFSFEPGDNVVWAGKTATVRNSAHGSVWIKTADGVDRIIPEKELKAAQTAKRHRA